MTENTLVKPKKFSSLKAFFRRDNKSDSTSVSSGTSSPRFASSPRLGSSSNFGSSVSLNSLSSSSRQYGKKISLLGTGITAKVDLLYNKGSNSHYAVKTFKPKESYESREEYRERCSREFDVVSGLNHPNILKLYDFLAGVQVHQIVMEYAPYSLLSLIQLTKPCEAEVLCFFRQVCEGLWYLHKNYIAHRDLKMENLVIDETATVKLIDFGTAFTFGPDKKLAIGNVGTESLVSPEALSKLKYDSEANDVWSLAVLLYSMIHLTFPWKSSRESDPEFVAFKRDREVLRGEYPETIWQVAAGMLETDPTRRFTMSGVRDLVATIVPLHSECNPILHRRTTRMCQKRKDQLTHF